GRVVLTVLRVDPGGGWEPKMVPVQWSRRLRHPAVIQTFSSGVHQGTPFVVTEAVDGVGLDRLISALGPLPPAALLEVGSTLCDALAHAHSLTDSGRPVPLLHRHLRPSHVMVGRSGGLKIRGFGLGSFVSLGPPTASRDLSSAAFASPEVLSGQAADGRADLFALGALLVFASLGVSPFSVPKGAQMGDRIAAIVRAQTDESLFQRLDERVPGLGILIRRLIAVNADQRPSDALEVQATFAELAGAFEGGTDLSQVATALLGATTAGGSRLLEPELEQPTDVGRPASQKVHQMQVGRPEPPPVAVSQRPLVSATPSVSSSAVTPRPVSRSDLTTNPGAPVPHNPASISSAGGAGAPPGPGLAQPSASGVAYPPVGPPTSPTLGGRRRQTQKTGTGFALALVAGVGALALVVVVLLYVVAMKVGTTTPGADASAKDNEDAGSVSGAAAGGEVNPDAGAASSGMSAGGVADGDPIVAVRMEDFLEEGERPSDSESGETADGSEDTEPVSATSRDVKVSRTGSRLEQGSVNLNVEHRPVPSGDSGASSLLSVKIRGPSDTRALLYFGPAGGPYNSTELRAKKGGFWEGWLRLDAPSGGTVEYWIEASHPAALSDARSGSRDQPHSVQIR
ncbi:MAG TPA: hypothetical protein DIU15_06165, partial [Deltaproteobacteria bacterium]|nr:hypothetical protein [Deltaproteobacteria bacterium]